MYCPRCGLQNSEDNEFCSKCGALLSLENLSDSTIRFTPPLTEEVTVKVEKVPRKIGTLVIKQGIGSGEEFVLDKGTISVGRNPGSDIFLNDVTVSRRHAEIFRKGKIYEIKDIGSLNGTYVNKKRVESAELNNGDEIQIGRFKMVFLGK